MTALPRTALVIGGGFVGMACAWQLARGGFRTRVVDPGDPRSAASFGNAGHLATEQVEPLASYATLRSLPRRLYSCGGPVGLPLRDVAAWLPFGFRLLAAAAPKRFERGKRALRALIAEALPAWRRLADETGSRHLLREDGHFVVWESARSGERGRKAWLAADIGDATVADATPDEIAALRARFSGRPAAALRFRNTGQIVEIEAMRGAIAHAFRDAGGTHTAGSAAAVHVDGGVASVVLQGGATIAADAVVVAAGVRSAALLSRFEKSIPLIAERGYHVETAVSEERWPHDLPPVAFEDRSVIVTRFRSTLRLAGFTEFAHPESPADSRKWRRLERHAEELGMPANGERSRWFGARPTLADYLPAIGRAAAARNLYYAFGHQHLGVTLSAVTGELVAAMATASRAGVDTAPFDLRRFQ
jgi:D-amino-acid dehydrogenase